MRKRKKIIDHDVHHDSYLSANKHLLQQLIIVFTDMSLCFLGLFMSWKDLNLALTYVRITR